MELIKAFDFFFILSFFLSFLRKIRFVFHSIFYPIIKLNFNIFHILPRLNAVPMLLRQWLLAPFPFPLIICIRDSCPPFSSSVFLVVQFPRPSLLVRYAINLRASTEQLLPLILLQRQALETRVLEAGKSYRKHLVCFTTRENTKQFSLVCATLQRHSFPLMPKVPDNANSASLSSSLNGN